MTIAIVALIAGVMLFLAIRHARSPAQVIPLAMAESPAAPAAPTLDDLFDKYGAQQNVDPLLLKAVAKAESNLNPSAVRNNPPHDVSVGVMQILYLPSVEGDLTSPPRNRFNVNGWEQATFEKLQDPEFNIWIGSQILSYNLRIYGYPRGVAVYNSWSARNAPTHGPFPNQEYVNRVLRNYAILKGETT